MPTKEISTKYISSFENEKDRVKAVSLLNKLDQCEKRIDKPLELFAESDFKEMFGSFKWVSHSMFSSYKTRVVDFVEWDRNENGTRYNWNVEELCERDVPVVDDYGYSYFASEDEFIEALTIILSDEMFYMARAIAAMYWVGLSQEDAINLEKTDLNAEAKSIGRVKNVRKELYDFVKECADANGYYVSTRGGQKRVNYASSDYVLRKTDAKGEVEQFASKIDKVLVNRILFKAGEKFKSLSPEHKFYCKKLSFKTLRTNYKFCKMYELEQKYNDMHLFDSTTVNDVDQLALVRMEFPDENWDISSVAEKYAHLFRDYRTWKKFFHGN